MPLIIFAIPIYMMFQWVGLLDTQIGLGLILTIVNLPLALVMLVNAINDVPIELDEAAKIDGAGTLASLLRIIRPVVRPAHRHLPASSASSPPGTSSCSA